MAYLGSEETTPVKLANELEEIDGASIHLSGNDGKTVASATQIVFHKRENGALGIELFTKEALKNRFPYYIFELDDEARRKLREFLDTEFLF